MAGKGDKPRPVNKKTYNENFDQIKWNRNHISRETIKVNQKLNKLTFKY